MFWQGVAALIVVVLCGWTLVERQWVGLVFALVVLCFELQSIRTTLR
jgi:hypothetical protein